MNRRAFLQRFGVGVVGALALAHVPAAVVKAVGLQEPARRYACEYLRKIYNSHAAGDHRKHPRVMHAGRDLFEAFESEITACERFVSNDREFAGTRHLAFKGAKLICSGTGWRAEVIA